MGLHCLPHLYEEKWLMLWAHLYLSTLLRWTCDSPSILLIQLVQYLVSESVLKVVGVLQANLNAWVPRQQIPNSVFQENPVLWGREYLNIYLKVVRFFNIWFFIYEPWTETSKYHPKSTTSLSLGSKIYKIYPDENAEKLL